MTRDELVSKTLGQKIAYDLTREHFTDHFATNISQEQFQDIIRGVVDAIEDIVTEYTEGQATLMDLIE